jgi:hypothetical protein
MKLLLDENLPIKLKEYFSDVHQILTIKEMNWILENGCSYTTHNLEQGVDIWYIQHWLGHDSIRTTERYTHVAGRKHNFKNPIDDIL